MTTQTPKTQTPRFCLKDLHFFEKDLHCKLVSTLSPKMFFCHTTFIERIKMFTFSGSIAVASRGYKTDFNLNNIATTLKNSPANVIKVSAAIVNLVSFSLFDRHSDKPEKINTPLLSGSCL